MADFIKIYSVFAFVFGIIIGSFLNVVIYRLPRKISFTGKARSVCTSCGYQLRWFDLIPLFSYIFLRGKCRKCGERISLRYPAVEFITGVLYFLAFVKFINIDDFKPAEFAVCLVLFPLLVTASFLDIDTGEVPYFFPIGIAVLGAVSVALSLGGGGYTDVTLFWHILGAFIIAVPFAVICFFGGMGGADVQLMAAAGLLLGRGILPAAFIGIVAGGIAGVIVMRQKKPDNTEEKSEEETDEDEESEEKSEETPRLQIRFVPYLSFGIAVSALFGEQIIAAYTGLLQ